MDDMFFSINYFINISTETNAKVCFLTFQSQIQCDYHNQDRSGSPKSKRYISTVYRVKKI